MIFIKRINEIYQKAHRRIGDLVSIGNYLAQYSENHGVFWLKHHQTVIFEIDYKHKVYAVNGYSLSDKNAVNTLFQIIGINRKWVTRNFENVLLGDEEEPYKFLGFGNTESLIREHVIHVLCSEEERC